MRYHEELETKTLSFWLRHNDIKHMKKKQCAKCKKILTVDSFWKNKNAKDGLRSYCIICESKRRIQYRKSEKGKQWGVEYRKRNYEKRKAYMREYCKKEKYKLMKRISSKILRKKYPQKDKARQMLYGKIRYGVIKKRNICEICYNSPTHTHHEDYNKPLEFIELCIKCHTLLHQQYAT